MSHRKHDYSPISWHCVECGTYAGDVIASSFPCRPTTDDSGLPSDCEPAPVEVDYAAITKAIAGC